MQDTKDRNIQTPNPETEDFDEDRTILSEQDIGDLDSVVLDFDDEEAEEREKAIKKKLLIIAGAALFAAAVTATVLILTRKKETK